MRCKIEQDEGSGAFGSFAEEIAREKRGVIYDREGKKRGILVCTSSSFVGKMFNYRADQTARAGRRELKPRACQKIRTAKIRWWSPANA